MRIPEGVDRNGLASKRFSRAYGSAVLISLVLVVLAARTARAGTETLSTTMSGGQETPPNASGATGNCTANVNTATLQVTFSGTFANLGAAATAAAMHGPAASGADAPAILPATSLSAAITGSFSGSGTLTSSQVAAILAGNVYCEIDDPAFPSGEIRGQLTPPPAVPGLGPVGAASLALVLLGLGAAGPGTRRRLFNRP